MMFFPDMFQYNGQISCHQINTWWHIGMYLAPSESAMVLSTSEMETRDHKSVPIPTHQKFIGFPTKIWMRSLRNSHVVGWRSCILSHSSILVKFIRVKSPSAYSPKTRTYCRHSAFKAAKLFLRYSIRHHQYQLPSFWTFQGVGYSLNVEFQNLK